MTSPKYTYKGIDIATIDIPRLYLHTEPYVYIITILKGRPVELLVNIDPKLHWEYSAIEKGVNISYVR